LNQDLALGKNNYLPKILTTKQASIPPRVKSKKADRSQSSISSEQSTHSIRKSSARSRKSFKASHIRIASDNVP
jgi:hypothetical protein